MLLSATSPANFAAKQQSMVVKYRLRIQVVRFTILVVIIRNLVYFSGSQFPHDYMELTLLSSLQGSCEGLIYEKNLK